jgi:Na+-translocating ferredoxin:NAD+ oxidoreductase RnfA subunit
MNKVQYLVILLYNILIVRMEKVISFVINHSDQSSINTLGIFLPYMYLNDISFL